MLYRTLKRMIRRGQTEGLRDKMAVLYTTDALTEAEYTELIELL